MVDMGDFAYVCIRFQYESSMRKRVIYIFSLVATLVFSSCGEDRSGEYLALIEKDQWIVETMRDIYLWYYDIPADDALTFTAAPKDFFPKLLSKQDRFSYIELTESTTKSIDNSSTYGFDFLLYTPKGAPKERVARVIFVLPGSPAAEAGLKRGDWITGIHGETLTQSNYGYLYNGGDEELVTATLEVEEDGTLVWNEDKRLQITASRWVENNPFYVDTVYTVGSTKIAYLMYNLFSTGPQDLPGGKEYNDQMRAIFSHFKGSDINDFILDLRYNPGGYLTCSQVLASLLAPADKLGETYCSLAFNQLNIDQDFSLPLDKDLTGGANLNLKRLYVIVTNQTASASEAVINCLRPYMDVILIGTKTVGKNVASEPYSTEKHPGFILHPMVAFVNNSLGEANYADGIKPDYTLDESVFTETLKELGDTEEIMLRNTIALITEGEGAMPDVKLPEETKALSGSKSSALLPVYNSLERKKVNGVLLAPRSDN